MSRPAPQSGAGRSCLPTLPSYY